MSQCGQCKKNVGCGCNLVNGLCAACYELWKKQQQNPNNVNQSNNNNQQSH